jgi:hypothetical protein
MYKEQSMIQLTQEQHEELARNGPEGARVLDRITNVEYVLVPAEVYVRLKALWSDGLPETAALMNEVMAQDDAHDPYLEDYQRYQ